MTHDALSRWVFLEQIMADPFENASLDTEILEEEAAKAYKELLEIFSKIWL